MYYRQAWPTRAGARFAVAEYIEIFYDRRRLHSTLGYRTPLEALIDHPTSNTRLLINNPEELSKILDTAHAGYGHPLVRKSAPLDDELADAIAVLDAFHVVQLGMKAMEERRRRV
jgi:hypothetical protein